MNTYIASVIKRVRLAQWDFRLSAETVVVNKSDRDAILDCIAAIKAERNDAQAGVARLRVALQGALRELEACGVENSRAACDARAALFAPEREPSKLETWLGQAFSEATKEKQ